MPLWDKLRTELDRAGRAAQGAIDEGRIRLEAYRARQLADKAAQALGYAVYRARKENRELETDIYTRLSSTLAAHEADAERYERELREAQTTRRDEWAAAGRADTGGPADMPSGASGSSTSGGGASGASGGSGGPGGTAGTGGSGSSGSTGGTGGTGSTGSASSAGGSGPEATGSSHQPL